MFSQSASQDLNFIQSLICHLLGPADQHSCKEAQSHSEIVNKCLIVRDVSEMKHSTVTSVTICITHYTPPHFVLRHAKKNRKMSYLYQGYTKFSRTSSRILTKKKNRTGL